MLLSHALALTETIMRTQKYYMENGMEAVVAITSGENKP